MPATFHHPKTLELYLCSQSRASPFLSRSPLILIVFTSDIYLDLAKLTKSVPGATLFASWFLPCLALASLAFTRLAFVGRSPLASCVLFSPYRGNDIH